jgi:dihydrolipoamide dehydrogenase
MAERFDLVVIGGGPGGYVAAIRAAQLGLKVACVEKRSTLGGTCLNVGCIPSKAMLDSSELFALAKNRFGHHGIKIGAPELDLRQMLSRKEEVVSTLTRGIAGLFKKNKIEHFNGAGQLADQGQVVVKRGDGSSQQLQGKSILLATGSEPAELQALPFDGTNIVSSTEALCLEKVPKHLIVVGGGYIGLELGSVWARLGAKVTVLEFLPAILPLSDAELAGLMQKLLTKQGLNFHLETKVISAVPQAGQVVVEAQHKGDGVNFQGDKVLVAVGRRPYTTGLGLDEAGVEQEEKSGRIPVNDNFQTNIPGIYAIGDLIAGPMLAHKASEEGIAVAEYLAGRKPHVNYEAIPSVIYTHPELSSVGKTEEQLKEEGQEYRVGKFYFQASGRARCLDETDGLVKVLADAKTDRLLGVHILGPRASELIAEAVLAMEFGGSAEDIARTCHGHPTLSEAVAEAARGAWEKLLHG